MPLGKVKWFNNAKGFGFIIADKSEAESLLAEDLFAHFSSIQMEGYKTLKAGQRVTFEAQASGKGYHAINIVPVESPQTTSSESATKKNLTQASDHTDDAMFETA